MKCTIRSKRPGRLAGVVGATFSIALACSLAGAAAPQPAYAVTAAEVEAEAAEVLSQIQAMQGTLDDLSAQYFQALYEYQAAVESRDAAQARIDELSGEITDLQTRLGNRATEMYRGGSATVLDLLLGSTTFTDFATNWDLLNRLNENDANMTAQAKALRSEFQEQEAEYARQAQIAEQKSEEAAKAYADAQALVEEMQATYESLSAEAQELYAQEAAAAAAAAAAQAQAEAEAAAAAAAAQANYTGGYVNEDGTVTDAQTGQTYASQSEYHAATGNEVVDRAYSMIGSDYVWGGVGGSWGGFDCSGLVSYALTGQNTRLGTTATFINWNQVSDPQPGDVCVIHQENGSQHTGIYVGNGKMVHASTYGVGVVESDVQSGMIYVRP